MSNIFSIAGSGMAAERLRMDVIANNIANVNTTRDEDGQPYQRKVVVFREKLLETISGNGELRTAGVEVVGIRPDPSPFKLKYDPSHPDANAEGYVLMPNVDVATEMVDLITASKAYEANLSALQTAVSMYEQALNSLR